MRPVAKRIDNIGKVVYGTSGVYSNGPVSGFQRREEVEMPFYRTSKGMLSEWLLNSGAYMHWMWAVPVWYRPL